MSNNIVTMTAREKWVLEAKARTGWKAFYVAQEHIEQLQQTRNSLRANVEQIKNGTNIDLSHLTNMLLQLYDKVGELCDCPICFETMTKENTFVPSCGHLCCKDCKAKMEKNGCAICKRYF